MNLARIFHRAYDRLHQGWTTGSRARNFLGTIVSPTSSNARSWCLIGALEAASCEVLGCSSDDSQVNRVLAEFKALAGIDPDYPLASYNDTRTREEILEVMHRVVQASGAKPSGDPS